MGFKINWKIRNGEIDIEVEGRRPSRRLQYRYIITLHDTQMRYVGNDLGSGVDEPDNLTGLIKGLTSLFVFLGHDADRYESGYTDGDAPMFPGWIAQWASSVRDEITMDTCTWGLLSGEYTEEDLELHEDPDWDLMDYRDKMIAQYVTYDED